MRLCSAAWIGALEKGRIRALMHSARSAVVMIIDDTPENLKLLDRMLRDEGYRIKTFLQGEAALGAAEESPPDIILLDIKMPRMDGFEVCRRLKASVKLCHIPVLVISALLDRESKERAFAAGAVDYVTNPFQIEEIRARVKTHLRLRQMQIELEKHSHHLEDLVRQKAEEIANSRLATILAISALMEERDDGTGCHIDRTRIFCRLLAKKLMEHPRYAEIITPAFVDNMFHAAPLHDIGKIGIPDSILLKPGRLTPEEFEVIKTHTLRGARTLEKVHAKYPHNDFINMGMALTKYHHERWDGTGYPEGLAGEDIPLEARIMAVADVYDALRFERPYKGAFSHEYSYSLIVGESGKHFDPLVVEAFRSLEGLFAKICERLG